MNGKALAAKWHEVALSSDPDAVAAVLHDDAVFESPVVHTPQAGKDITTKYLTSAGNVFGDSQFRYVGEWYAENSCILEFKAEIDGIAVNGIDMITCNDDGLITHFKVMVRPLKAVNMLHAKMGEMLQKMAGQ
jgi:SnoaL-like domain